MGFPDSRAVAQSIATQRMGGLHGGAGTPTCDIFDGMYVNDSSGLGGIGCAGLLWIVIGSTTIWRRLHEGSPSSGIWRLLGLVGDQIRVGKYVYWPRCSWNSNLPQSVKGKGDL